MKTNRRQRIHLRLWLGLRIIFGRAKCFTYIELSGTERKKMIKHSIEGQDGLPSVEYNNATIGMSDYHSMLLMKAISEENHGLNFAMEKGLYEAELTETIQKVKEEEKDALDN